MTRYAQILLVIVLFMFTSCKVDFSPNAAWKEIPVVYCLLDQDEDTICARVQKCYLGEGNLYEYATVYDSINYPEGTIEVWLLKWNATRGEHNALFKAGPAPVDRLQLQYTLVSHKDIGMFAAPYQPLYCAERGSFLDTSYVYELIVVKQNETHDTLARATTALIGAPANVVVKPNNSSIFHFMVNNRCEMMWSTMTRVRSYQPMVRFYYLEQGEKRYVDIDCSRVNDINTPTLSSYIYQDPFLSTIKAALIDDTCSKLFVDTVDIYIHSCTEELNAYLASSASSGSAEQEHQSYTNVEGGLGIFSARRTHIWRAVPSDGDVGPKRLHAKLKELGVGFE